jgi:hypothetical protein
MQAENNRVHGLGGGISTSSHPMTTMTCLPTTPPASRTRSASSGSAIATSSTKPYDQPVVTHSLRQIWNPTRFTATYLCAAVLR